MLCNVFQAGLFDLYGSEDAARATVRAAVEAGSFTHAWMVEALNPGHVFEITNFANMVEEKLPEVLWKGERAYSGSVGDVIIEGHERGWLVLPVGFADLDRDFVRWFETKVPQCMLRGEILGKEMVAVQRGRCRFCGAFTGSVSTCDACAEEAGW